jgi:hypothetical protein
MNFARYLPATILNLIRKSVERTKQSFSARILKQNAFSITIAILLMTIAAKSASAQVTLTVPGSVSPSIQITGSVPMRALVQSGNSFNIKTVQVFDGSTQIANYAGNGTNSIDVRGVFALSSGTHTMTVTGTDTNNGTVTASTTFVVAANGSVTQSPAVDSEIPSPVSWQATCTANTGHVITSMKVYKDFPTNNVPIASFTGLSQNTVTESQSFDSTQIPAGSHSLTTNCFDDSNPVQVYQSSVDFTVGTSFPAAPGNAVSLNLDNPSGGWTACSGCSGTPGGDAQNSDTYPAVPPTYPTIDNDSRNFSITTTDGGTFQGYLWFTGLTNSGSQFANGFPISWIFDYYVNISNPLNPDYALEFDANQTPGAPSGDGYVLGTECNYGANPLNGNPTIWRFWDVSTWNDTYNNGGALSCPLTAAGHWYHVQMYFTINTGTNKYTVQNVRVTDTTLNSVVQDSSSTFSFGVTNTTGHGNSIDVQQDGNNNHTYSATYDKINIIRW